MAGLRVLGLGFTACGLNSVGQLRPLQKHVKVSDDTRPNYCLLCKIKLVTIY